MLVKKESGYSLKALRTDHDGEFTSKLFNDFCEAYGIWQFLIVLRWAQQNGVMKRKNRTIFDMIHSILKRKNIPKEFWAEDMACVVYWSN